MSPDDTRKPVPTRKPVATTMGRFLIRRYGFRTRYLFDTGYPGAWIDYRHRYGPPKVYMPPAPSFLSR